MRLVEEEVGGVAALDGRARTAVQGFETTTVVLAGALPTPTLLALVAPLVLRSGVLVKTSSHDPVTAACLREMLLEIDPLLAGCLEVVSVPGRDPARLEALLEADCVMASGTDATVAEIARHVAPPRRAVLRGHRVSVAAFGPDLAGGETLEGAARGLAFDVALWDQLGCLSPVVALVPDAASADRLAEALAAGLADAQARWPRGRVPEPAAARIAHERDDAEFRAAAGGEVRLLAGEGFTVVREADARPRPAPLHRFVRIHPCGGTAGILSALRPLGSHLAGVATAGFGRDREDFHLEISRLGASRVCDPGRLQAPPLAWHQDGQGVLPPLARLCDLEEHPINPD